MSRILIADDEAPLRKLLCRFLETRGHEVLAVQDGQEALRAGEDLLDSLDLLIIDIRMPGLAGTEVARKLKQSRADLKVLLISGYSEGRSIREPFLQKPFTPSTLLDRVQELLEQPEPGVAQIRGK